MNKKQALSLQLFAEDPALPCTGNETSNQAASPAGTRDGEQTAPAAENAERARTDSSAPERGGEQQPAITWQEVLNNPEFNRNIQNIVAARSAKAAAELQETRRELERLRARVPEENSGEAGDKTRLQQREQRLEQREAALEARERDSRMRGHFHRLEQQAEDLKRELPDFNLMQELEDPAFLRLTSPEVGLDVEAAYYALHHADLRASAAESAARAVSEAVRSGAGLPQENGAVRTGAPLSRPRYYSQMSPEERAVQKRLILSGQKF